ncbi:EF-hand domain-containing protein [Sphingomonas baiyangensis]|uniref:Histidine kinase n=1 Tax=Sphingomonas baiyangensis TaxID=2572576 RepID=A0A4U1L2I8_9SPHN|nr:EF-hand domain-containing protein [Sphingomonas baiyangensis]TKD50694.1 histidine kinase [Sphingomonas baiyangensis]
MWRYLVGALAALLLGGAGLFLFGTSASERVALAAPPDPPAADDREAATDAVPEVRVPEATPKTREEKRFDRYDKDRDDSITRDEYLASRRKAFAKLDTNGDGRLSFDEWAIRTTTRFADADADRSRTLDRSEFATTAPKRRAPRRAAACPPAGEEG